MWMDNGHTDGWILGPQVRETQKNEKKRKKSVTVYRMLLELMFALPMYASESILSTYWVLVEVRGMSLCWPQVTKRNIWR